MKRRLHTCKKIARKLREADAQVALETVATAWHFGGALGVDAHALTDVL